MHFITEQGWTSCGEAVHRMHFIYRTRVDFMWRGCAPHAFHLQNKGGLHVERLCTACISSQNKGGLHVERLCTACISSTEQGWTSCGEAVHRMHFIYRTRVDFMWRGCAPHAFHLQNKGGLHVERLCTACISSTEQGWTSCGEAVHRMHFIYRTRVDFMWRGCAPHAFHLQNKGGLHVERLCTACISSTEQGWTSCGETVYRMHFIYRTRVDFMWRGCAPHAFQLTWQSIRATS
ncbi:hypothetical protein EOD39_8310 [Acipenser ruthenus]|uniref:Uncharacterized protein n=1 Tax=Acipenser ruthenus TaxID=7906 RepID=A0A662YYM7_ACIRT|nr:hypothetical protein EOD39_8310 [Acipenser ruthenus]